MNCPICGTKMKNTYYTEEHWGIVEEHDDCPKCDYSEEFAYGNYRIGIPSYWLDWSYCTKPTNTEKLRFRIHMWKYRKQLLRNNKIYGRGIMKYFK